MQVQKKEASRTWVCDFRKLGENVDIGEEHVRVMCGKYIRKVSALGGRALRPQLVGLVGRQNMSVREANF